MVNRTLVNGLILLGAGLLASSVSSFLEHFTILGAATDLTRGFLDGLSASVFCVAVYALVRSRHATPE